MSVQAVESFSPYSNTLAYLQGGLPTWMSQQDAERINSYQVYEQIYWNVPETFKLIQRGSDAAPIYVPTARTIVDTTNRYLAPRPGFVIDPDLGTPEDQALCKRMFSSLFRRERFWSKFNSSKRYGIIRGDWCWHVLANPQKPLGRRLTIEPIDPASYFPVTHPNDPDRIIGAHIVEQVMDAEGKVFIKRQTYWRGADPVNNLGNDTSIWNSVGLFDVEKWQDIDANPITVVKPPTRLPDPISAIPIYHVKNIETPGDPFGSSELRGFERIMAAVNQAISDEEMTLALEGLGLYATDGGAPRDERGRVTDWILGPGQVVEHSKGSVFKRVNGVTSVDPVQSHLDFLIKSLKEASATPDAAVGRVDVQVAESGIALAMQMHPMLSKVEEREDSINDVHEQFFYDLRFWMKAYEAFETPCIPHIVYGSRLPENRSAAIKEVLDIVGAGLADADWARAQLEEFGFDFETGMGDRVIREAALRARAVDPFAARMSSEEDEEGADDDA